MGIGNTRYPFEENAIYHIYNRGYLKSNLFVNTTQFDKFFDILADNLEKFPSLVMMSYCILPNHFHFVIQNKAHGHDISDFMKRVQGRYATWIRTKHPLEHKQPVFEGRFKAKHISTERYLHQCLAYVNFNAVKHAIVQDVSEYPYSSYHQIVYGKQLSKVDIGYKKQDFLQYSHLDIGELEL